MFHRHKLVNVALKKGALIVRRATLAGLILCGVLQMSSVARAIDFDGDGKSDRTVYRPSGGRWFFTPSASSNTALSFQWGLPGDYPVGGNYTSTAGADMAVWRETDGVWYIRNRNAALTFPTSSAYQWGLPMVMGGSDKPYPCDFNGDGLNELAVFRNATGTWYLRNSTSSPATTFQSATSQQWGLPGDAPIPADYDGDGKCDFSVFRGGSWYIILSSAGTPTASIIAWGSSGDIPVPGQYTSDSVRDFAVYRAQSGGVSLWVVRNSNSAGLKGDTYAWGLENDQPVPGDYDGDGKTDIAVWRPSDGVWYVRTSASSYATAQAFQFGLSGDIAVGDRRGAGADASVAGAKKK